MTKETEREKEAKKHLNKRQLDFIHEYMKTNNITQSATKAGYSPKTAAVQGCNLLKNVKITVLNERKMSAQVIELLEEVERRKLYSDLKYKNLFDYCVKELGYSENQAWRRIILITLNNFAYFF